jgi:hypothetical protein
LGGAGQDSEHFEHLVDVDVRVGEELGLAAAQRLGQLRAVEIGVADAAVELGGLGEAAVAVLVVLADVLEEQLQVAGIFEGVGRPALRRLAPTLGTDVCEGPCEALLGGQELRRVSRRRTPRGRREALRACSALM